jgi:hypothetical protein
MNAPVKLAPTERIFKRLAATYGAAWDRSLGQTPIEDVMTAWDHELSGFLQSKVAMNAIAWALENLPDTCPNVMQFKAICRRAPATMLPALPEPSADAARVAAELAKLGHLRNPITIGPKAWAHKILARKEAGESINTTSYRMARRAVGLE